MKIRQIFLVLIFILFSSTSTVYAKEACKDIYGAIGVFVKIADDIWKKRTMKRRQFYTYKQQQIMQLFMKRYAGRKNFIVTETL